MLASIIINQIRKKKLSNKFLKRVANRRSLDDEAADYCMS